MEDHDDGNIEENLKVADMSIKAKERKEIHDSKIAQENFDAEDEIIETKNTEMEQPRKQDHGPHGTGSPIGGAQANGNHVTTTGMIFHI